MRTKRILAVALMAAVGVLTLVTQAQADNRRMPSAPPVPSLTKVSATTQTPALVTITGNAFTPGGRVYLATIDQLEARISETRLITASAAPQAPATQPSPDYAAQMAGNESGGTFGFTAAPATTPRPD
jgi:predicted RND superfamily exporter protein